MNVQQAFCVDTMISLSSYPDKQKAYQMVSEQFVAGEEMATKRLENGEGALGRLQVEQQKQSLQSLVQTQAEILWRLNQLLEKKGIPTGSDSNIATGRPRDCWYWLNSICYSRKCAFRHPPREGLLGDDISTLMEPPPSEPTPHSPQMPSPPYVVNEKKKKRRRPEMAREKGTDYGSSNRPLPPPPPPQPLLSPPPPPPQVPPPSTPPLFPQEVPPLLLLNKRAITPPPPSLKMSYENGPPSPQPSPSTQKSPPPPPPNVQNRRDGARLERGPGSGGRPPPEVEVQNNGMQRGPTRASGRFRSTKDGATYEHQWTLSQRTEDQQNFREITAPLKEVTTKEKLGQLLYAASKVSWAKIGQSGSLKVDRTMILELDIMDLVKLSPSRIESMIKGIFIRPHTTSIMKFIPQELKLGPFINGLKICKWANSSTSRPHKEDQALDLNKAYHDSDVDGGNDQRRFRLSIVPIISCRVIDVPLFCHTDAESITYKSFTKPLDTSHHVFAVNRTYDQPWAPIEGPAHPHIRDASIEPLLFIIHESHSETYVWERDRFLHRESPIRSLVYNNMKDPKDADAHADSLWLPHYYRNEFTDFKIVRRISPKAWSPIEVLWGLFPTEEYESIACAWIEMVTPKIHKTEKRKVKIDKELAAIQKFLLHFRSTNLKSNQLLLKEPICMALMMKLVGTLRPDSGAVEVIFRCLMAGKPAVVTRVVVSMIDNLRPTRAKATDVANAVLNDADAILLGAETMRGLYLVESIFVVSKFCCESEKEYNQDSYFKETVKYMGEPLSHLKSVAVRAAIKVKASVIICFTSSGRAARLIAKYRLTMSVLSIVTPRLKTNQLCWTFTNSRL